VQPGGDRYALFTRLGAKEALSTGTDLYVIHTTDRDHRWALNDQEHGNLRREGFESPLSHQRLRSIPGSDGRAKPPSRIALKLHSFRPIIGIL